MRKIGVNEKGQESKVIVAVDPGYDGTKVTVNGERFSIPKTTVKKIGNEFESTGSLEGIYEVTTEKGTFLCGPNIRNLVDMSKDFHTRYDKDADQTGNYSYFVTDEFVANTLGAITMALIMAEQKKVIKDASKADLYTILPLPHQAYESMTSPVAGKLLGNHSVTFKGTVGDEYIDRQIDFSIPDDNEHFIVTSQVIACLTGFMPDIIP